MTVDTKDRLRKIEQQLQSIPKSNPKSLDLYCEAAELFERMGNKRRAQQCLHIAKRLKKAGSFALVDLPIEILQLITRYLSHSTLLVLCKVSKELRTKLCTSYLFWLHFDLKGLTEKLSNQDFSRIWKLNGGQCKTLVLRKAKRLTSQFAKDIHQELPICLETLEIQNSPKITGVSVLRFLARPSVHVTLSKLILVGISDLNSFCLSRILKFLTRLTYLDVSHSSIDDTAFQTREPVKCQLQVIRLTGTGITKNGLCLLNGICGDSLRELVVDQCQRLGPDCVESLSLFKNLESVQLNNIRDETPTPAWIEIMDNFGQSCSKLRHISWKGCPRLLDEGLCSFFERSRGIVSVALDRCAGVRTESVRKLFQLPNIRNVALPYCQRFDIIASMQMIPLTIEYLDFSYHPNVNDQFLERCTQLPMLRHLRVAGCSQITSPGASMLKLKIGRSFQTLDLSENPNISPESIRTLTSKFGKAVIFHYSQK
jgi:hypothetical protein